MNDAIILMHRYCPTSFILPSSRPRNLIVCHFGISAMLNASGASVFCEVARFLDLVAP